MSYSVTSVFTFKIESTFEEWAAIFDSEEAAKRHTEFDIKPLFRGVNKEDPQKELPPFDLKAQLLHQLF